MPPEHSFFLGPVQVAASILSQVTPIVGFYFAWRKRWTTIRAIAAASIAGALPLTLWVLGARTLGIVSSDAMVLMLIGSLVPGAIIGILGVLITSVIRAVVRRERSASAP